MTPAQKKHLASIQKRFCRDVEKKYSRGVREHGGNLWEKNNILDEAIDEVIDLAVYLLTLKQNEEKNKAK